MRWGLMIMVKIRRVDGWGRGACSQTTHGCGQMIRNRHGPGAERSWSLKVGTAHAVSWYGRAGESNLAGEAGPD